MQNVIKNHKLSLGIASLLAIMALATSLAFVAPTADAVPAAMIKQIDGYTSGGVWCGYKRYFCDGSIYTSPGFTSPGVTQYVTTYLNQCGGEEF